MTLPAHVQIGPIRYSISVDLVSDNADLIGRTNHHAQTIVIRLGLGPDQEAETLLHEALHGVFVAAGLAARYTNDEQEVFISSLAPLLLDALRRNPELVAYLTKVEAP